MEGKNPREIKGWAVKWQRALVTPFRDATALEADTMQMVRTVFTGKKKHDLRTLYTH